MTLIADIRKNFEEFDFMTKYTPEVHPINNLEEIERITKKLASLDDEYDSKAKFFLEQDLESQITGYPAELKAFKSYYSFNRFEWFSKKRPFMRGSYDFKNNEFNLSFTPRFPEKVEKLKYLRSIGLNASYTKGGEFEEFKKVLDVAMETEKRNRGIDESVELLPLSFLRFFDSEFLIKTTSTNLSVAHENLVDAMGKLGYINGVVYKR